MASQRTSLSHTTYVALDSPVLPIQFLNVSLELCRDGADRHCVVLVQGRVDVVRLLEVSQLRLQHVRGEERVGYLRAGETTWNVMEDGFRK